MTLRFAQQASRDAYAAIAAIAVVSAIACAACASAGGDKFVATKGSSNTIAQWAVTSDGRLRVPLAAGLTWETRPTADSLLKAGAPEGPTYVVVAVIESAPRPLARGTCAEAHRTQLIVAFAQKGIAMTTPAITMETHKGEELPRLHYWIPLEVSGGEKPASTLSSWGYWIVADRCVGISVTTIVHAKDGAPDQPNPDDVQRGEHVFEVALDGAELTKKPVP